MIAGLTGGIGSGKTMVARLLEILGCAIFYSDTAAKEAYCDPRVRKEVIALLGKDAYLSENEIDRSWITKKIFNDTDLLQKLNGIIHPQVKKMFEAFVQKNKGKLIVKETALLFEARLEKQVDKIILVAADDELRIQRVVKRDHLSREEVLKKMKSQLAQEEKIKLSHYVIYNNEKESLISQVLAVHAELIKEMSSI